MTDVFSSRRLLFYLSFEPMIRDIRYKTVKKLLVTGQIEAFRDIFDIIPKSIVARDMGMNNTRFTRLITNVDYFSLDEIVSMASFIEVDGKIIVDLIWAQDETDTKSKKKK